MNLVDLLIILFLLGAFAIGFIRGLLQQLVQIAALLVAVVTSLLLYPRIGNWFEQSLNLPTSYAQAISLVIIFVILAWLFQLVASLLYKLVAPTVNANLLNRILGGVLGALRGALVLSVILAVLLALPIPASSKDAITSSPTAKPLISFALSIETWLAKTFNDPSLASLSFQSIGTNETTTIALNYTVSNPQTNPTDEVKLLGLINAARNEAGVPMVKPNVVLQQVAEAHAKDMLEKGYLSQLSPPNGKTPADRVKASGYVATVVGENIASAPSVQIAEVSFLASTDHRKVMLDKDFTDVGVAVVDAGSHGKMIVEVFAVGFNQS